MLLARIRQEVLDLVDDDDAGYARHRLKTPKNLQLSPMAGGSNKPRFLLSVLIAASGFSPEPQD